MPLIIGNMAVDLEARTGRYQADMRRAQTITARASSAMRRSLGGVTASIGRMARGMASWRGAMAAAAGVAGLLFVVNRSIDAAEQIGKVADSVGISTAALQEYRYAADIVGVEQGKLDKAFLGFAKRLGETRLGTGEMITILNKLDPALLENLKNTKSVEEALDLFLKALAEIPDQADRAALAAAGFGARVGGPMSLLVKGGADQVSNLREEARKLGLVMSDEMVRAAEGAKDALTKVETVAGTAALVLANTLAPTVTRLAEHLIEQAPRISGAIESMIPTELLGFDALSRRIAGLQRELAGLEEASSTFMGRFRLSFDPSLRHVGLFGDPGLSQRTAEIRTEIDHLMRQRAQRRAPAVAPAAPAVAPAAPAVSEAERAALRAKTFTGVSGRMPAPVTPSFFIRVEATALEQGVATMVRQIVDELMPQLIEAVEDARGRGEVLAFAMGQ